MNKTHLLDTCKIPDVHYKMLIYVYFKVSDNILGVRARGIQKYMHTMSLRTSCAGEKFKIWLIWGNVSLKQLSL